MTRERRQARVFLTYSPDSEEHQQLVHEFATFLRDEAGLAVKLDRWAATGRFDWSLWAAARLAAADFVLVVGSPGYDRAVPSEGSGVRFEAALVRDNFGRGLPRGARRVLPVVLPGRSADELPEFLNTHSTKRYVIREFSPDGVGELLAVFTGTAPVKRPGEPSPVLVAAELKPVDQGADIRFGGADLDGLHHGESILFRPDSTAHEPHGVVEYNLARRFRSFETVAGVLDNAEDPGQTGYFQVFLDGVAQPPAEARLGRPAWLRHDVAGALRLRLVAYRRGVGARQGTPPALAWGNPTLTA